MRCNWIVLLAVALTACGGKEVTHDGPCDSDNAGLTLPEGFCARIYADEIGVARHLVVAPNGDVYVAMENSRVSGAGTTKMPRDSGGVAMLRDTSGDGRADIKKIFHDDEGGSGIALLADTLFFSTPSTVYRFTIDTTRFGVLRDQKIVVAPLPRGGHSARSLALGDSGTLFVNIGSDGNVCGTDDPCAQLSERAGIWRFDAHRLDQTLTDGVRYATGIRNAVGLVWNFDFHSLFATQHGRDALGAHKGYSKQDNDVLPSEEFVRVRPGDDFGWPYCYHDWRINQMVLGPEYGGDGIKQGRCANVARPLIGFPGHWAPDGLLFYNATQFPAHYRTGAFITFHGSWNRSKQDGYRVVFVPFKGAMPEGDYEIFADGFAGRRKSPSGASHRPVGLAVAPDGTLFVSDDQRGRVYAITYRGNQ